MRSSDVLLLDTHAWLWWVQADSRMGRDRSLQKAIDRCAGLGTLWLSALSVWEIAMLDAKSRINLGRDCHAWVNEALIASRVHLAPLEPTISIASTRLDGFPNADPADRIIAATAIQNGWTLVTADKHLVGYFKKRKMPVWGIE